MLAMRLRIPELMETHEPEPIKTAYKLQQLSRGRLSMTNATHLVEKRGNTSSVRMTTLEVLCDIFGVGPGDLLERDADAQPPAPVETPAVTKRKSAAKQKPRRGRKRR
jgi:DNA-binding Xre family transcriptional regulator